MRLLCGSNAVCVCMIISLGLAQMHFKQTQEQRGSVYNRLITQIYSIHKCWSVGMYNVEHH